MTSTNQEMAEGDALGCAMTPTSEACSDAAPADAQPEGGAPTRPQSEGILSTAIWSSDEFRMAYLKVLPCSRRAAHNWKSCPFVHPGERVRRRSLAQHSYSAVMCSYARRQETCPLGDACTKSHNIFEAYMHPDLYKTQLCTDGRNCRRSVCFFAHNASELRPPGPSGLPISHSCPLPLSAEAADSQDTQPYLAGLGPAVQGSHPAAFTSQPVPSISMVLPTTALLVPEQQQQQQQPQVHWQLQQQLQPQQQQQSPQQQPALFRWVSLGSSDEGACSDRVSPSVTLPRSGGSLTMPPSPGGYIMVGGIQPQQQQPQHSPIMAVQQQQHSPVTVVQQVGFEAAGQLPLRPPLLEPPGLPICGPAMSSPVLAVPSSGAMLHVLVQESISSNHAAGAARSSALQADAAARQAVDRAASLAMHLGMVGLTANQQPQQPQQLVVVNQSMEGANVMWEIPGCATACPIPSTAVNRGGPSVMSGPQAVAVLGPQQPSSHHMDLGAGLMATLNPGEVGVAAGPMVYFLGVHQASTPPRAAGG